EADAQRVYLDVAVGELVLHGLERGERAAELLPRRQVVGGQAQRALRHAELDGRERDAGQPQRGRQGAVAERLRGRPVEGEVGGLVARGRLRALPGQSLGGGLHQVQARGAVGGGGDQDVARAGRGGDDRLGAGQRPAVPGAHRG